MPPPTLSVIIAVRDTDDELESFLGAVHGCGTSVELVFGVLGDDAFCDEVAALVAARGIEADVFRASEPDLSRARREGLSRANGDWATFPVARDVYAPGSLGAVLSAIEQFSAEADVFVMPMTTRSDVIDAVPTVDHGVRLRPLDEALTSLPSSPTQLVMRRSEVPLDGIALYTYADNLLTLDLLEGQGSPQTLAMVTGARYLRRTPQQPDPQTEHLRSDARHYEAFADALAARFGGEAEPTSWRHRLAMREVFRLVGFENTTVRRSTTLVGEAGRHFRATLREALRAFDESLFARVNAPESFDERRDALLALRGRASVAERAHLVSVEEGLMQLRHSHWVEHLEGSFAIDGEPVTPRHAKRRTIEAFGVRVFDQMIAWLPADGRVTLTAAETDVVLAFASGRDVPWDADVKQIAVRHRAEELERQRTASSGAGRGLRSLVRRKLKDARRSWLSRAAAVRMLARVPLVAREFRDAWLLMDRADMGRDNAEHMYRWLAENHPEINAWFVLRGDSPDFARLKAEGFRLVAYGSIRHQLLLNRTTHYLSSHVGIDVSRPIFDRYLLRESPWTFTFLQHGVIHNDLSTWLNRQKVRMFVTSTPQEYEGIAGDDSPYVFTEREVRLTGLPRFDKLRQIADAAPLDERRTIVIAPTWRNGLFDPPKRSGELRQPKPGFAETPFIRSILDVLNDDRLKVLFERGYTIKFVPHPNLAAHFPYESVPSHVSVTTYADSDVQELIGTAAVFVTDYSSVAFDAAFAGTPVVYMQLDEGAIYGKDHTLFPGYFDFERDGFGPVTRTIDKAVESVVAAVEEGVPDVYQQRARDTFPLWDSNACERVHEAVRAHDDEHRVSSRRTPMNTTESASSEGSPQQ